MLTPFLFAGQSSLCIIVQPKRHRMHSDCSFWITICPANSLNLGIGIWLVQIKQSNVSPPWVWSLTCKYHAGVAGLLGAISSVHSMSHAPIVTLRAVNPYVSASFDEAEKSSGLQPSVTRQRKGACVLANHSSAGEDITLAIAQPYLDYTQLPFVPAVVTAGVTHIEWWGLWSIKMEIPIIRIRPGCQQKVVLLSA